MNVLIKAIRYIAPLLKPRAFFATLIFNFHYLPFRQAIMLPIWIYRPHFVKMGGVILIDNQHIRCGMIRLGFLCARMYPNNGIQWMHQGKIVFKGKCQVANNSFIVTGKKGYIEFGENFMASPTKIISFIGIKFGEGTRLGYDVLIMDTNFHPLYDMEKQCFKKAYGKIEIGDYNWFGAQCAIMHSVKTPERCIFGMRSVVTRGGNYEPYCVHGGSPIRVLSRGVKRIYGQDKISEYVE